MTKELYLLLGSNLGEKLKNLDTALAAINAQIGKVESSSSLYETEPWGEIPTETFINQMLKVNTKLSPQQVMEKIISIEESMGRTREKKWENRIIDIDIIFYGKEIISSQSLQIPHPQFEKRNFAILPMMELAPDFVHPSLNLSIEEIYLSSKDEGEVMLMDDEE